MIPAGVRLTAISIRSYYLNGAVVTDYKVLIPDHTISGDFRFEYYTVSQPARLGGSNG